MQKQRDVYLLRAIRKVKKYIPVRFRFINVKGYMDDESNFEELDRIAQLNILCYNMAKKFLYAAIQQKVVAQSVIPHDSWGISVEGEKNHIFSR